MSQNRCSYLFGQFVYDLVQRSIKSAQPTPPPPAQCIHCMEQAGASRSTTCAVTTKLYLKRFVFSECNALSNMVTGFTLIYCAHSEICYYFSTYPNLKFPNIMRAHVTILLIGDSLYTRFFFPRFSISDLPFQHPNFAWPERIELNLGPSYLLTLPD